jgi:three-Cys-motif partner protein
MQIGWATVEAIAQTRAIDCWYFFPLMGLYRQAANLAPNIDTCKRERLNWLLGGSEWERAWYSTPHGPFDLFGGRAEAIRIADVAATERFVNEAGERSAGVAALSEATRKGHSSSQSRIPAPHRWRGELPIRFFAAPSQPGFSWE